MRSKSTFKFIYCADNFKTVTKLSKHTTFFIAVILLCMHLPAYNQDQGSFSGGFQSSANFFIRDSLIGAANIPQYDNELFGAQSWLDLGYTYITQGVGGGFY